MGEPIKKLTIEGFKSISKLENFELRSLNVFIGANGAGKSNFVGFFDLLRERLAVEKEDGADAWLYLGPKITKQIVAKLYFGINGYQFTLVPTVDGRRLVFADESTVYKGYRTSLGSGHTEAKLRDHRNAPSAKAKVPDYVFASASSWVVYHFHDTSSTAGVRRLGPISANESFRSNAENLAAFLYRIQQTDPTSYARVRDVVRLAAPFFDDFNLRPVVTNPELIQLEWLQRDSDYPFRASQLSDGTLRFICLATALLQPSPPPTMLFDEPELGLHPYALTLLASLFQQAAKQYDTYISKQVIISTQSAPLLNEFAPEDVIIVERTQGESTFRRLDSANLSEWLKEYALGELWQKNVLGGRPQSEDAPQPSSVGGDRHS